MQLSEFNQQRYTLNQSRYIPRLDATMSVLTHNHTQAKLIVVETNDDNKVFSVTFKTLPSDGTGVAHIIEHSVLCGSDQYPVKDPFIELAKGSLNTFTNAMTFPDKTIYPIASCNLQDFKNAMAIYCDAVFHPLMLTNEKIFQQEGWHYEFDDADHLTINGVVYNEMKGVFSSVEDCINEYIMQSMFPNTCYGVCSGGDPDIIPSLTYDDFKAFHGKYYHPSNARFFLYGDCEMNERLQWLDETVLSGYTTQSVDTTIKMQSGFDHMHTMVVPYSVDGDITHEYYYAYNIGFDHSLTPKEVLAYRILVHALFNGNGALLRDALNEKGIGSDMMATLMDGIVQPYISIIVKHASKNDQQLLLDTIQCVIDQAIDHGCDHEKLLGALNTIHFSYIEGTSGLPYGLTMNLSILDNWLYEKDPYEPIMLDETFDDLKHEIEADGLKAYATKVFENLDYTSLVVMEPVNGLAKQKENELNQRLQNYAASLSKSQKEALKAQTSALKAFQQCENDPDDLAKLPMLTKADLDDHIRPSNLVKTTIADYPLAYTVSSQCGDIVYINMMIDLDGMMEKDIAMAAIIGRLWTRISTTSHDYDQLENCIMLEGGGINAAMDLVATNHNTDFKLAWFVNAKCFMDQIDDYMPLIHEILTTSWFDCKRVSTVVDEIVSDMAAALQGSAHGYAINRAFSKLRLVYSIKEKINGLDFYHDLKMIQTMLHDDPCAAQSWLNHAQQMVRSWMDQSRIHFHVTLNPIHVDQFKSIFERSLKPLQWFEPQDHPFVSYTFAQGSNEAYTTAGNVNYAALALPVEIHDRIGTWQVFVNVMNYDYLWTQLRVLGGAYGQFALTTRSGLLGFVSYRDPHCASTYHIYDQVADYLDQLDFDDSTMLKFIIGTIGTIDAPLPPARFGAACYLNDLNGITDEKRQAEKRQILSCTLDQLKALGSIIRNGKPRYRCVIGNPISIEKAKDLFDVVEPLL